MPHQPAIEHIFSATMNQSSMKYAVIGDPISHSLSPIMHNAAFQALGMNAVYSAEHVLKDGDALPQFLDRARKTLCGFNITVPHKTAVIPFLDEISERSRLAMSVNTVTVKEGRLIGDTTDGTGLELAVQEAFGLELTKRHICIIGCGGVVRALAFHLANAGAASIAIINRTRDKADALLELVKVHFPMVECASAALADTALSGELLSRAELILQCTSVGLHEGDPTPIDSQLLPVQACYFDTIYRETELLKAARARGLRVSGGMGMLLHQGAASFRIWTDRQAPVEVMRQALLKASSPHAN